MHYIRLNEICQDFLKKTMLSLLMRTIASVRQDWVNEICWTWLISTVPSIFFCLFAFSFSLAVGHVGFLSLANRGFQVFGQFQDLYYIYKLLYRNRIIVNTKGCEKNASLLFHITALVVRSFLQTLLDRKSVV